MKRGGIRDNYDDGGGISSACNSRRDRKSADPAARAAVRNKKMTTAAICMGKTEEKYWDNDDRDDEIGRSAAHIAFPTISFRLIPLP